MGRKVRHSVLRFGVYRKPYDSRVKFSEIVAGKPDGYVLAPDLDSARLAATKQFAGSYVVHLVPAGQKE